MREGREGTGTAQESTLGEGEGGGRGRGPVRTGTAQKNTHGEERKGGRGREGEGWGEVEGERRRGEWERV